MEQGELARLVGVTQQTVSKWETGVTVPRPTRMAALAHALDLDAGLLHATASLTDDEDGHGASRSRRGGRAPKGVRLGDFTEEQLIALLDATWRELRRRRQPGRTNHASRR